MKVMVDNQQLVEWGKILDTFYLQDDTLRNSNALTLDGAVTFNGQSDFNVTAKFHSNVQIQALYTNYINGNLYLTGSYVTAAGFEYWQFGYDSTPMTIREASVNEDGAIGNGTAGQIGTFTLNYLKRDTPSGNAFTKLGRLTLNISSTPTSGQPLTIPAEGLGIDYGFINLPPLNNAGGPQCRTLYFSYADDTITIAADDWATILPQGLYKCHLVGYKDN